MPVTFPLSLSDFFSDIGKVEMTFHLTDNQNDMRTAGGSLITSEYGTRLWHGRVQLRTLPHVDAEDVLARVRVITNGRATFFAAPVHRLITGIGGTPTLNTVSDGYNVRLAGLPANYFLRRGAFFQLNPTTGKNNIYQVAEDVYADGSGLTPLFTVEPAVRPGWAAGNGITFGSARITAKYKPRTLSGGAIRGVVTGGVSFEWEQVL